MGRRVSVRKRDKPPARFQVVSTRMSRNHLPMNRRKALTFLAGGAIGVLAATSVATLRLHKAPRTYPLLEDGHLAALAAAPRGGKRVLFIGNSMLLDHDVPGRVAEAAATDGVTLDVATAAARGARLIETSRLSALDTILRPGVWDAVVLQDFTRTPLRRFDRWGSAWAIGKIVARTAPTPIVLFPPWPAAEGNAVYTHAGLFAAIPDGPDDYAARTMDFYNRVAAQHQACLAPVPRAWREAIQAGQALFAPDGHHANPAGATLVAGVLWDCLREVLKCPDGCFPPS